MDRWQQQGVTLVEMVLAIVLIGLIAGVAAMAIQHGVRASVETTTRTETLSKLRLASERLAREIRGVRRNPASTTSFDFISRTANSMSFRRLASNGTTVITVTIDGSAPPLLRLGYDNPPGNPVLTDQVNSVQFIYLQANGTTPATGNSDLAFIEIALTLTDGHGNGFSERTRIGLRNR